jgi:ABC-type Fe3+-hydroxamate transport system substrate-binding protein
LKVAAANIVLLIWACFNGAALLLGIFHPSSRHSGGLSGNPQHVAIYPPLLSAYLTTDHSGDHVAAISETEKETIAAGLLGEIFPAVRRAATLITVGSRSAIPGDPEQILSLMPDRVIVWAGTGEGLDKIGAPIEEIRNTDLVTTWQRISEIAGRPNAVVELIASLREAQEDIRHTIGIPLEVKKQRVMLLWRNEAGSWRVASGSHRDVQYLTGMGVAGLPSSRWKGRTQAGSFLVDPEEILKFDPDVIFLSCCASVFDIPSTLYNDPVLRPIAAVRMHRVYKAPSGAARMDSLVEYPLLVRWYAAILYPDRFSMDWRKAFKAAYWRVYGYTIENSVLDQMLFVNENRESLSYSRFFEDGASAASEEGGR